jgi:hypothetical protein
MVSIARTGVFEDNYFQRLKIRKEFVDICKSDLKNSTSFLDYLSGTRRFSGKDLEAEIISGVETRPASFDGVQNHSSSNYGHVWVALRTNEKEGNELYDRIYEELKIAADKYMASKK